MDRDTKFCDSFRSILKQSDVEPVILPPPSPSLNSYLERFLGSLKSEYLHKMIFLGEKSLCRAVSTYLVIYHKERNHQSLDISIIMPGDEVGNAVGEFERLGGMLNCY